MSTAHDLVHLYAVLDRLRERVGGYYRLADVDGRKDWPARGVYFFFEPGEYRSGSGDGLRVVRVGTHALKEGSRTTLWTRLSQHRGTVRTGSGNHRGSIFRLLVGEAMQRKEPEWHVPSWGIASDPGKAAQKLGQPRDVLKEREQALEKRVSAYIAALRFLYLRVDDAAAPDSDRGRIERNAIALLSNAGKTPIDAPSSQWLGHHSGRDAVRASGLWNVNHVTEAHDPGALDVMAWWCERTSKP